VADDPNNTAMANRAVRMIADKRGSATLHGWLTTGEVRNGSMGIDEACEHLQIQLEVVDQSMLQFVFESARRDNPGQRTEQAIDVVTRAHERGTAVTSHSPGAWPVGLTSHGNTCYLNSLLQYYFTIKPLRDIVLQFDAHRFDIDQQITKSERVGGLKVRPFEIRAYQKFVDDLRHLFDRMIKDPGSAVKPEADLVCRAFLKAEDTDVRVPSTATSEVGKEDVNNKEVTNRMDLVNDHVGLTNGDKDAITDATQSSSTEIGSRPLSVASSATLGNDASEAMPDAMTTSTIFHAPTPPASRPSSRAELTGDTLKLPPLPPRCPATPDTQQSNLSKAEEAARQQQDVTEVMDEILFRLRAAIRPKGVDAREEQLDLFRDIFFTRISVSGRSRTAKTRPQAMRTPSTSC